jgi:hypothetical protein
VESTNPTYLLPATGFYYSNLVSSPVFEHAFELFGIARRLDIYYPGFTLAFIELRNFMAITKEFCQGILNSPIFTENGGQLGSVQNTRERQERGMFII